MGFYHNWFYNSGNGGVIILGWKIKLLCGWGYEFICLLRKKEIAVLWFMNR